MLHQGASTDEVAIDKASLEANGNGPSAYGGGHCEGIVVPALTRRRPGQPANTIPFSSGPLTVDLAVSSDGAQVATVQAGSADANAPQPHTVFNEDADRFATSSTPPSFGQFGGPAVVPPGIDAARAGSSQVTLMPVANMTATQQRCGFSIGTSVIGQATAVTYVTRSTGREDLLVQSREPALLTIVQSPTLGQGPPAAPSTLVLGGESVLDTGHEIFHRDAGGGIACASCHAEGAEDGHVWKFNTVGLRRTQALHVGLEGTAPFHWNGEEFDLGRLMEDVFVGRMGGVHQGEPRLAALTKWLFALQPPAADHALDQQAVARGEELYMSPQVGCADCHSGIKLTNNRSADVGTGGMLQVPSLRAVAYRAPFMHDGCAKTLRDRFQVGCGGSKHGNTAALSDEQLDDLVTYLKTL
jgi:mono/diheme cytochrome c family protein